MLIKRADNAWASLPLRVKGLVVVAIPLVALLLASLSTYLLQQKQNQEQAAIRGILTVRGQIQTVRALLVDAETGARGFRLTGDEAFLDPYERAFERLPVALANLERLVGGSPSQVARARKIRFLAGRKLESLARFASPRSAPTNSTATDLLTDKRLMDRIRVELAAMQDEQERRLTDRGARLRTSRTLESAVFVGSVLLGLAGGLLAMVLFTAGIARRIHTLEQSARRLAEGSPLLDRPPGNDEVGRLAGALEAASRLLADRDRRLRDSKERAELANWAKTDFLSRTSHELRTPLTAIVGFAHFISRRKLEAREREAVEHILKAGQHLTAVVNDVLDIARIEAGGLPVRLEPVAVAQAVGSALDLATPLAQEAGIRTEDKLGDCYDDYVLADAQRLQQILLNLISNAIKYNQPEGRVTVACTKLDDGRLRIDVSDTGRGIEADKLERLFEPYDRLGAESSEAAGVGLGLPISRSLVELMNGSLLVTSTPNVGSTFSIDLPVATAPLAEEAAARETTS